MIHYQLVDQIRQLHSSGTIAQACKMQDAVPCDKMAYLLVSLVFLLLLCCSCLLFEFVSIRIQEGVVACFELSVNLSYLHVL